MRFPFVLRLSVLLGGACTGALVSLPQAAYAQPAKKPGKDPAKDPKTAEAKKFFDEGSDAYHDGRYEDAVKAWEKSYELSGKPLIFESIANAYERAGDKKKAREFLVKWRSEAPKAEHDQLDARIKNLDARIAAAEAADAANKGDDAKKKGELAATEKASKEAAKAQEEARSKRLVLGLAVGGVGVLAVGAGVVLDVVAAGQRPDAKTACSVAGDKTLCRASARDGIESSSTLALVGDITWIAGAAIAAAGGVLLFTLPDAPKAGAKGPVTGGSRGGLNESGTGQRWISIAPMVSVGGGGVGLSGAF